MAFRGNEFAVTGTATSLTNALGAPFTTDVSKRHCKQVIMRLNPAAANPAFWGESDVTTTTNRAGTLASTDLAPTVIGNTGEGELLNTDNIFLIGTAGATNIVFITVVS